MTTDTVKFELGNVDEIRRLFSYPANWNEIPFLKRTMEDTIGHYLSSSIRRDGFDNSAVQVWIEDHRVLVEIGGAAGPVYAVLLPRFLAAGQLALAASQKLAEIPWQKGGWRYNWRFFLPLGVAMAQHHTVQLLHFPPDSVLERDEDYLKASTTRRWGRLLAENQVTETDRYQNIIDIAPISAPSDDGKNLDAANVYKYYEEYILALLKQWLPRPDGVVRPLVAFGSPVRKWIKTKYNLDESVDVLSLVDLQLDETLRVKTLFANHPSYIFNADEHFTDDPDTKPDERLPELMLIVRQDLIAARWQAEMGKRPSADAQMVLDECTAYWSQQTQQERICVLTCMDSLGARTVEEATQKCGELSEAKRVLAQVVGNPLGPEAQQYDARLRQVSTEVGCLDARSPKVIALNKGRPTPTSIGSEPLYV